MKYLIIRKTNEPFPKVSLVDSCNEPTEAVNICRKAEQKEMAEIGCKAGKMRTVLGETGIPEQTFPIPELEGKWISYSFRKTETTPESKSQK